MFLVQTIKDNVIEENFDFEYRTPAQEKFFDLVRPHVNESMLSELLDLGYFTIGNFSVCFSEINNTEPKGDKELIDSAKITVDLDDDVTDDDDVSMEIFIHGKFHFSIGEHGLTKNDVDFAIKDALEECHKSIGDRCVELTGMEVVVY